MKRSFLIVIIFIFSLHSCKKDNSTLSTVETYIPKYITSTSATLGCIVESDGGSPITSCGIYFGTSQNPETTGSKFEFGSDTGTYLGMITGLNKSTQYYFKAYASNKNGQALSEQMNFSTPSTIIDYDNNVYEIAIIGSQQWMKENLKTTRYLNGDVIGTTTPATKDINAEATPKYQWSYDGNESNVNTYGRLYTWYTITDSRSICPTGWHVPSKAEWEVLISTLGGENEAGGKLKESGTNHWTTPNTGATNESGFTALPSGYRYETSTFNQVGNYGNWWSSTESTNGNAWDLGMGFNGSAVSLTQHGMDNGFSVRCIKD